MAKQKASMHKGKVSGQTGEKHMERDFDFERGDEHIDPTMTKLNVVKSFCPNGGSELAFYEERYRESLDLQNAKYEAKRNYDRIRTMQEVHETKKKRPTEEILQYSKNGGVEIDKDTYDEIVDEYVKRLNEWSSAHGNHFHVLKYATHYDEPCGMTHTHLRTIWDYEDENGVVHIGQEEGMKQAGLEIPNPTKLQKDIARAEKHKANAEACVTEWEVKTDGSGKELSRKAKSFSDKKMYDSEMKKYREGVESAKRYNNRGITWTEMQREMWEDLLDEYGYECDRVRAPKRKHQSQKEWDAEMTQKSHELQLAVEAAKKTSMEWQEMKENEDIFIRKRAVDMAQKVYDEALDEAKKDALEEVQAEREKILDEAKREAFAIKKEASSLAEKEREDYYRLKKENEKLKIENHRIDVAIENNQDTIDLINNREAILKRQQAQLAENKQSMQQQAVQQQVIQTGDDVERRRTYGNNIDKFINDDDL